MSQILTPLSSYFTELKKTLLAKFSPVKKIALLHGYTVYQNVSLSLENSGGCLKMPGYEHKAMTLRQSFFISSLS